MKTIINTIDQLIISLKAKKLFKTAQRLLQVKILINRYNEVKAYILAEIEQAQFILSIN